MDTFLIRKRDVPARIQRQIGVFFYFLCVQQAFPRHSIPLIQTPFSPLSHIFTWVKGKPFSSFMGHFISRRTSPFIVASSTSGHALKLLNYFNASNTSPNYGSPAMSQLWFKPTPPRSSTSHPSVYRQLSVGW